MCYPGIVAIYTCHYIWIWIYVYLMGLLTILSSFEKTLSAHLDHKALLKSSLHYAMLGTT